MKFKAIIFDLDGTIVDTSDIWHRANELLIESKGITYTPELRELIQSKIHGLATHRSCSIIKDVLSLPDELDSLISEKRKIAQQLYETKLAFIDGFEEFHDDVEELGLLHGIATNADDTTVSLTDKSLNLRKFFGEHIYGISCVNYVCKPDPAIYLHAAEQLGCKPADCLAIEDSAHGIEAAQRAGLFCIGINTAKSHDQVKKADLIVDEYQAIDLKKLL